MLNHYFLSRTAELWKITFYYKRFIKETIAMGFKEHLALVRRRPLAGLERRGDAWTREQTNTKKRNREEWWGDSRPLASDRSINQEGFVSEDVMMPTLRSTGRRSQATPLFPACIHVLKHFATSFLALIIKILILKPEGDGRENSKITRSVEVVQIFIFV